MDNTTTISRTGGSAPALYVEDGGRVGGGSAASGGGGYALPLSAATVDASAGADSPGASGRRLLRHGPTSGGGGSGSGFDHAALAFKGGGSVGAVAGGLRVRRALALLTVALAATAALATASLAASVAAGRRAEAATAAAAAAAASSGNRGGGDSGASGTAGPIRRAWRPLKRVAFGSCTAYDARPQPVWTEGVVPAAPDAWVWLGDLAYMDNPLTDCAVAPQSAECRCEATFLKRPPFNCFAGDAAHARRRVQLQLALPEYRAFVDAMCPPPPPAPSGGRGAAFAPFPPDGADPAACRSPIFGTWDDHDSGWNNGNRRNPMLAEIKNVFLDALGEPQGSARRSAARGLEAHYILPLATGDDNGDDNGDSSRGRRLEGAAATGRGLAESAAAAAAAAGRTAAASGSASPRPELDLILLDGRYHREPLPCEARAAWCRGVLSQGDAFPDAGERAWCEDFLNGGDLGGGSCCRKDGEWAAWCARRGASASSPLWRRLCDPTAAEFADAPALLLPDNATAAAGAAALVAAWSDAAAAGASWRRLAEGAESPICEVLGPSQRRWLRAALSRGGNGAGDAKKQPPPPPLLTLVASGSVVAGSLGHLEANGTSACDGDDWGCYPRARNNLLHTLANLTRSCVVVITGDYHMSDIKAVLPGRPKGTNYTDELQSERLAKPIWQVMASGLTTSTARYGGEPCEGSWRDDVAGLRPLGRCAYAAQPAFGAVEVDARRRRAVLSIRDAAGGGVAVGRDGSRQEVVISLDTCLRVE